MPRAANRITGSRYYCEASLLPRLIPRPVQALADFLHQRFELFFMTPVPMFGLEKRIFRLLHHVNAVIEHCSLSIQLMLENLDPQPGRAVEPVGAHEVIDEGAALFEY
jgi:hypothetical protein